MAFSYTQPRMSSAVPEMLSDTLILDLLQRGRGIAAHMLCCRGCWLPSSRWPVRWRTYDIAIYVATEAPKETEEDPAGGVGTLHRAEQRFAKSWRAAQLVDTQNASIAFLMHWCNYYSLRINWYVQWHWSSRSGTDGLGTVDSKTIEINV